jgi:hypothetical protein
MKLMENEDEEVILNNDSTQLLKNIQKNKKKILVETAHHKQPEALPDIGKRSSRLDVLKNVMTPVEDRHSENRWKALANQVNIHQSHHQYHQ